MDAMDKRLLREHIQQLRSALPSDQHKMQSEAVCRRVTDFIEHLHLPPAADSWVLIYLPIFPEVDIHPVVRWLWRSGYRTAAPVVRKQTRMLEWRQVRRYEDLLPGTWGILEPGPDCPLVPDAQDAALVLVPGLAFDRMGGRLGYGGGYYDRFLGQAASAGQESKGQSPVKLAAAFDFQLVAQVPVEEHDCPVDVVITESQTLCTAAPSAASPTV